MDAEDGAGGVCCCAAAGGVGAGGAVAGGCLRGGGGWVGRVLGDVLGIAAAATVAHEAVDDLAGLVEDFYLDFVGGGGGVGGGLGLGGVGEGGVRGGDA